MAATSPNCVHLSTLYAGSNALFYWQQVEQADGYELECSLDDSFARAVSGLSWGYLDRLEYNWENIHADVDSWLKFDSIPAKGYSWQAIRQNRAKWGDLDALGCSWANWADVPAHFTIYRGPAHIIPGIEQGRKWDDLDLADYTWDAVDATALWNDWDEFERLGDRGLTWGQVSGKELTWREIDALPDPLDPGSTGYSWYAFQQLPVQGLDWEILQARQHDWQAIEQAIDSWAEFESLPAHTTPHVGTLAFVPDGNWRGHYRVRAYDTNGRYSDYTEAQKAPLIHQAQVDMDLRNGTDYDIQINATKVRDFSDASFLLTYNPAILSLKAFALYATDGNNGLTQALPKMVAKGEGFLLFKCLSDILPGTVTNGLIVRLSFHSLLTCFANVKLDSFSKESRIY